MDSAKGSGGPEGRAAGSALQAVRVVVVMGAAGSGKTTVGRRLAADLGWPFYDGDDFQPAANLAKMSQGLALGDQDRIPWLRALHDLAEGILSGRGHGVIACSALKASYRDTLKGRLSGMAFAYLKGSFALLDSRLKTRAGHFFKADLLATQFEILEEPTEALVVDAALPPEAAVEAIRRGLGLGEASGSA